MMNKHDYYMQLALKEAQCAFDEDEIPVGAIVVCQDKIIAKTHNLTQHLNDVTAHAEMQAITSAENALGGKYLKGCTLYVTLEPCPMCAAALRWAQLETLVFGASDPKGGYRLISDQLLHPKTIVEHGILEENCTQLMTTFFQSKRP